MADRRPGTASVTRMATFACGPVRTRLDGGRWQFQHGPIELILEAEGDLRACEEAHERCWLRFQTVLTELVSELQRLRRPASELLSRATPVVSGGVAARMVRACMPFARERFLTPMAAVAGAVAEELIEFFKLPAIRRAYINNGGDIALHLVTGESYRVGIWSNLERHPRAEAAGCELDGDFAVEAAMPVRGIATSGWRGRSFSLGIADSVTVLADGAAAADAAATLIANAVDCEFEGIVRVPADQIKDETDLGGLRVTVAVPPLPPEAVARALQSGRLEAEYWLDRRLVRAAVLFLQGRVETVLPRAPRTGARGLLPFRSAREVA